MQSSNKIPMHINGVRVFILEPVNCQKEIKRTWRERLFTLPFTPFNKTKTITELVDVIKDGDVMKLNNSLHMNIRTWNQILKET